MEIAILAGSTAKIPFRGIPGIGRIPADSGRNTWGTVKNSEGREDETRRRGTRWKDDEDRQDDGEHDGKTTGSRKKKTTRTDKTKRRRMAG